MALWNRSKKKKNNFSKKLIPTSSIINELSEVYLFDFKNYGSTSGVNSITVNSDTVMFGFANVSPNDGSNDIGDENVINVPKIQIKPIDVLNELETLPNPWNLNNLDDKIAMLEIKEKLIVQQYAKREVIALKERLYNRKKYHNFKEFFEQFPYTTEEKVKVLLDKYNLVMKPSDIFIPEFPDVAVQIMDKYITEVEKLCNKKPVFYVIATPENFRDADGKRDPILLVQSPFSFQYQILGAWDKEMLLLSEL